LGKKESTRGRSYLRLVVPFRERRRSGGQQAEETNQLISGKSVESSNPMAFALEDFEKPSNPAATGGEDRNGGRVGGKLESQSRSWQLASDVLVGRRHAAREARGVNGM
jgi:hypothetical protein